MVTLYCQSCGERHIDNLTSAAITYCYKCQGTHFANIQPAALRAEREPATEAVLLEMAAQAAEQEEIPAQGEMPPEIIKRVLAQDTVYVEHAIRGAVIATVRAIAERIRALKGKGASQGAEEDKCSK